MATNFFRAALSDPSKFDEGARDMDQLLALQRKNKALTEIKNLKDSELVQSNVGLDIGLNPDLRPERKEEIGLDYLKGLQEYGSQSLGPATGATTEAIVTADNRNKALADRKSKRFSGLFLDTDIGQDPDTIMKDKSGDNISLFDYLVLGDKPYDEKRGGYYDPKFQKGIKTSPSADPAMMGETIDAIQSGEEDMVTPADATVGTGGLSDETETSAISQGIDYRAGTQLFKDMGIDKEKLDRRNTDMLTPAEKKFNDYLEKTGKPGFFERLSNNMPQEYLYLKYKAEKSRDDLDLSTLEPKNDLAKLYSKDPAAAGQELQTVLDDRERYKQETNRLIKIANIYKKYGQVKEYGIAMEKLEGRRNVLAGKDTNILYHQGMKGLSDLGFGDTARINAVLSNSIGKDYQVILRENGNMDIEIQGQLLDKYTNLSPDKVHKIIRPLFDATYRQQQAARLIKQADALFKSDMDIRVNRAQAYDEYKKIGYENQFKLLLKDIENKKSVLKFDTTSGDGFIYENGQYYKIEEGTDMNNEPILIKRLIGGGGNYSKDAYNTAVGE